jgi:penicillin amidase
MSADVADQLCAMASASLPPVEGDLIAGELAAPVEVLRDAWGVPYLTAASLEDLWFAQGFVTAGERLFQMDLALRAANGRLSEVFADRTLAEDRLARVVGFRRTGDRIAGAYDDESRAMVSRFRDGARAWVAQMPVKPIEYTLLDFEPALPTDLGAWAACAVSLAWGLSGNWTQELLRVAIGARLGPEGLATLLPPSSDPPGLAAGALGGKLLDVAAASPKGRGSNNWVLAGSRTMSGKPLLANDPHLEVAQPGAWLEMGLRAPGYEARGVTLPFAAGVILGATPHHAWGATNVTGDVQDLYLERLNQEGTAARVGDTWVPLTTHREEIQVRGNAEPVVVQVHETRHGPILESVVIGETDPEYVPLTETYALRWTGHEVAIAPSAFLAIARATDFASFREALREVGCPGQNFVYADVDGHIGYQCTGRYPLRRAGDGTVPVPGWTDQHEWDGVIPFEELPWAQDPGHGYLATANNRIHDDAYPHLIGHDFHAPFRVRRVVDRIEALDAHDVASTAAIQADTVSLAARSVLASALPDVASMGTDEGRRAHGLLSSWDGDLAAGSEAAAVYHGWIWELAVRLLPAELLDPYIAWREPFVCLALPAMQVAPAVSAEALDAAAARVPAGTTWGELHTLRLVHPLGKMPGLEPLFVAAEVPLGGDEQTVAQAGFDARGGGADPAVIASLRAVWDLDDLDRSVTVLPAGVSGNPASPHWNDQAPRWAAGGSHPAPVSRPAIEAAAVSALRLLPG